MTHAAGSRHSVSMTRESTFGTTPTASLLQVSTTSVDDTDDSYNDATEDLSVFKAGDMILVSGFTTAANNGLKHVVSATANKMIVEETLTTEAAGDVVDIEIAFEEVRNMGTTLMLSKDTFTSEEIRPDRQITDLRHGNKRVEGEVSFELSYGAFDRWIEAALQGAWSSDVLKAGTTERSFSVARIFEDVGEAILYDGVKINALSLSVPINGMVTGTFGLVGQSGASPTDVKTITPGGTIEIGDVFNILDADGNVLVTFTATAGTVANVTAGLVAAWNGSTNPICVQYTAADVTTHLTLTADTPGAWYGLTVSSSGGAETQTIAIHHSPVRPATAAAGNEPFDSFTGTIKEGGVAIATVTGIELSLENGMEQNFVLMDDECAQTVSGRSNVTGTVTAYFDDAALLSKFVDETITSLYFELEDPDGNKVLFELNEVKYTSADVPVDGEGPVIVTLAFQALRDDTDASNVKITRTDAP